MIEPINLDPKLVEMLRKSVPMTLAESLVNVQPMDPTLFKQLQESGMSEKDLIEQGYEPVSHMKLLWRKKDARPESE